MTKKIIMDHRDKSQYYQTAARFFFERRGAPFFLSPDEFSMLTKWASMGIPQRIVLEGIRNTFDEIRNKSFQKRRKTRLTQCDHKVLAAFIQYQDRKIGENDKSIQKDESIINLKREVIRFTDQIPSEINGLEKVFLQAQEILRQDHMDEDLLEKADAEVERILLDHGTEKEKARFLNGIKIEHKEKKERELQEIFRIRWIKYMRKKYKIPYLSVFYY